MFNLENIENMVFWHWWILALGLIILEVILPGSFYCG